MVGRTDDFGLNSVEDRVDVHDMQATILNCLGFDHTRLIRTYGSEVPPYRRERRGSQENVAVRLSMQLFLILLGCR